MWSLLALSPLLRIDEISEEEWSSLRKEIEAENALIVRSIHEAVPESKHSKEDLVQLFGEEAKEKKSHLQGRTIDVMRALFYAIRREGKEEIVVTDTFITEFQKGLQATEDPLYIALRAALLKTMDIRMNVRSLFMAIMNPIILCSLRKVLKTPEKDPIQTLKIMTRVLYDEELLLLVLQSNESNHFKALLLPHLRMSRDIGDDKLYEGIIPALDTKLVSWKKISSDTYKLTLKEEIVHKIHSDVSLSIDITISDTISIQHDPETLTITFIEDSITCKLAHGGISLGSLQKIRSLTEEERVATNNVKALESTVTASWGVHWALRLLGAPSTTFYVAHSTLWWYFRTIKKKGESQL